MNKSDNLEKAKEILLDIKYLEVRIKETEKAILNHTHIYYSYKTKNEWEHILTIKENSLKRLKTRYNNILKTNLF